MDDVFPKHIYHANQFDRKILLDFFATTKEIKEGKFDNKALEGKIVANLFYEPSTRTRFSFESATLNLGGKYISTEAAAAFSSSAKGESLEDTIKTVSQYADFIVLRHKDDDSSERAVKVTEVPLINAGSGSYQHPTQSLTDLYTIYEKFGRCDSLKVAVVGDLLRSRTVGSLIYMLSKFENNTFDFVSPSNSRLKESLIDHLKAQHASYNEYQSVEEMAMQDVDVVYVTRIQQERFANEKEYEEARGKVVVDATLVNKMKDEAIVLHPLPRLDELDTSVDSNPRAAYFQQVKNGVYVRMNLLSNLNTMWY